MKKFNEWVLLRESNEQVQNLLQRWEALRQQWQVGWQSSYDGPSKIAVVTQSANQVEQLNQMVQQLAPFFQSNPNLANKYKNLVTNMEWLVRAVTDSEQYKSTKGAWDKSHEMASGPSYFNQAFGAVSKDMEMLKSFANPSSGGPPRPGGLRRPGPPRPGE